MNIKEIRIKLKLTQSELADIIGLSRITVARYESNPHTLSLGKATKYMNTLIDYFGKESISEVSELININLGITDYIKELVMREFEIDKEHLSSFRVSQSINQYKMNDVLLFDKSQESTEVAGNFLIEINGTLTPARLEQRQRLIIANLDGFEEEISKKQIIAKILGFIRLERGSKVSRYNIC